MKKIEELQQNDLVVAKINYMATPCIFTRSESDGLVSLRFIKTPSQPPSDANRDYDIVRKKECILGCFENNEEGYKAMRQAVIDYNTPIHGCSLYFDAGTPTPTPVNTTPDNEVSVKRQMIAFAEWLSENEWVKRKATHPNKVGQYYSHKHCEYKTIEQLFDDYSNTTPDTKENHIVDANKKVTAVDWLKEQFLR